VLATKPDPHGQVDFPADIIYTGIADIGRTMGQPVVTEFGESERRSWDQQCKWTPLSAGLPDSAARSGNPGSGSED